MLALTLAFLALLAIVYILAGYPLLLAFLSRHNAQPIQRGSQQPSVSVIIAVYNGDQFLEDKLRSVFALEYPRDRLEVIVVSDGSTDRTEKIVRDWPDPRVSLLPLDRGGKPAALNAAIPIAISEILLLTDVRQKLAPNSLARLVENFADPRVGVVSGELRIQSGTRAEEADIGLYWRFESWMRNQLSAVDSMFGATGPFYAMRKNLAVPIPPDMLLDDMYLPLAAFFRGFRLVMDTRAVAWDIPTSLQTEFRRKMRTLAGNYQILFSYPALLGPGNRMWIHFVSYKFGRLILPWLLVLLLGASIFCPAPWNWILLIPQLAGYALAAMDSFLSRGLLKRVSSPARTFVAMMAATVAGLSVFFVPARSLWKVTSASKSPSGNRGSG